MIDLRMQIKSLRSLHDSQDVRIVLETLCNSLPELAPEKWDTKQPVKYEFDKQAIASIQKLRPLGLLWECSKPASWGNLRTSVFDTPLHADIWLRSESRGVDLEHVLEFLKRISPLVTADFAYAHLVTARDVARWRYGNQREATSCEVSNYGINTSTHALRRGIPDLYGAVVFGPSYVKHFGRKRLLSAPAAVVEELGPDQVYLQVCKGLDELREDFAAFDARRKQVKEHLGLESFQSYPLWGHALKEVVLPSGCISEERIDPIPSAAGGLPRVPKFDFDRYRSEDARFDLNEARERSMKRRRK